MFEHVGVQRYPVFFEKMRNLLDDDGIALLHSIGRTDGPGMTNPFIRKHIFPGGYSPALSEVLAVIEYYRLYVTDIEIFRLHYAETLKEWLRRFRDNRDTIAKIYDERFCRMWEYFLASSEMGFRSWLSIPKIPSGRIRRDSEHCDMIWIDDRDHESAVVGRWNAIQVA